MTRSSWLFAGAFLLLAGAVGSDWRLQALPSRQSAVRIQRRGIETESGGGDVPV